MHRWIAPRLPFFKKALHYLNTPRSLTIWLLLKNQEWDQLATIAADPLHYPEGVFSALRFRRDLMATDLLRKAPLPTTFDRSRAAFAAWEEAETSCYIQNQYLKTLYSTDANVDEWGFRQFLAATQNKVARWLGRVPPDLDGGFGPGTCVEYMGSDPTLVDKLWLTPTTTPLAAPYFRVLHGRTLWGLERAVAGLPESGLSTGNRLTTVPKDGKTDRPISIEPLGNLWLQLGVGRYLKRRLKLCGLPPFGGTSREILPGLQVSRPSAQDIHRLLAREGCGGKYATIDLSSASDTIATELVRRVIPPDWFELLYDLRSPKTSIPKKFGGGTRVLEKFSSMGNGFTFELETFIFLGLICTAFALTPGKDCWVFGDDIIVPANLGESVCNLLVWAGFKPNLKKTYLSGPFRESCGGFYHTGLDVNPVRIKEPIEDISSIFAFHNDLRRWGLPTPVTNIVAEWVPKRYRIFGPERLEGVVLHGSRFHTWVKDHIRYVNCLKFTPEDQIPLERWSGLHLSAILLGVRSKVTRRRTRMIPRKGVTSCS